MHGLSGTRRACSRSPVATTAQPELRVCTNKTCKRQGSLRILKVLEDMKIDGVDIHACGCLGQCGRGPNMALLPQGTVAYGVATPSLAMDLIQKSHNVQVDPGEMRAVLLRMEGNEHAQKGSFAAALESYQEALACDTPHGHHKVLANLSCVLLQLGRVQEAKAAALQAVNRAPSDWTTAKIRLIECCLASEQFGEACEWLRHAVNQDPTFMASPLYAMLADKVNTAKT